MRKIREVSAAGVTIVVEGGKDERVLKKMGVSGEIIKYSKRSNLINLMESSNVSEILILTDFDKEGERIAKEIEFIAFINGVKVDKELREKLANALKSYSLTIEGLDKMVDEYLSRETICSINRR